MLKIRKIIFIILFLFIAISSIALFVKYQYNKNHKKFNVILILIDATRADHLGCYGYKRDTSPNIDKFAKEGIVFTQTITQGPFTPPALFSILTSTYPNTHRVYTFGIPLSKEIKTLPEALKTKGYYLGLISGRGSFVEFNLPELEKKFDFHYPSSANYIKADEVTENAIEWLKLNKKKKFFLWLYYLDPPAPYRPPAPYDKLYANDKFVKEGNKIIPIADGSKWSRDGYGVIPRIAAVKNKMDTNYYIALYDGEIRFADEQIGRVLAELKRLNLYNNTLILITSDHGENMGEHNYYFSHGQNLYDELLRVPLIVYYKSIPGNKIIHNLVRSIDIMPTILDIVGIKVPWRFSGVSLVPLIERGEYHIKYSFSESWTIKCVRTEDWKLIYNIGGKYELYNLKDDPKESKNLVDIEKEKFRFLRSELDKWLKDTRGNITVQKPFLEEEAKNKLRSLGYIQ